MDKFNDIGIDDKLDWNRIEKLMRVGIFAACMVLVGDCSGCSSEIREMLSFAGNDSVLSVLDHPTCGTY